MPRPSKPTGSPTYPKRKAQGKMKPFTPYRKTQSAQLLNKQELKFLDTAVGITLDTTVEQVTSFNIVTQGDANNNRDGSVIQVKSVQINGRCANIPAASATSAGIAYIWVVLDKQPNGAAPTVTDYLTGTTAPTALPLVNNQYRFKTLGKIVIPLNSQAGVTTAYNNQSMPVEWYYKFKKPLEIRFNGNAGSVADVTSNNIHLIAGAADADDIIAFNATLRIRFTG